MNGITFTIGLLTGLYLGIITILAIRLLTPWATRHELRKELLQHEKVVVRLALNHQIGDNMSQ